MESKQITYEDVGKSGAYPHQFTYEAEVGEFSVPAINTRTAFGLTKREYFAASALQGILANGTTYMGYSPDAALATHAVTIADELLKALYPEAKQL